jgi:hypothetical protein
MKPAAMLRFVEGRCARVRDVDAKIFSAIAYLMLMTFLRIKTVKGRRYLYKQTSVRKGKKVRSIMEYICAIGWIAVAAASPGRPGGFSGNRPTDKRHIKHQEESDRELFAKNRAAFTVKQRQDYDRQQKAREYAKAMRESKLSRSERRERAEAREAAHRKQEETMEAVRKFKESLAAEKSDESTRST